MRLEWNAPAAFFYLIRKRKKMFSLEMKHEQFLCAVCGKITEKAALGGIDAFGNVLMPIEICRYCGPIDPEAMQLCREISSDCTRN
jgi:hypothetical protein